MELLTMPQGSDVVTTIHAVEVNSTVENNVREILQEIGIPQHILGYTYLSEAIILCYKDKNYIHKMTTKLYPEIAKKYSTTSARVERSIRHALKVAFETEQSNNIREKIFKIKIKQPSNAYAIATLTEYIKYKV